MHVPALEYRATEGAALDPVGHYIGTRAGVWLLRRCGCNACVQITTLHHRAGELATVDLVGHLPTAGVRPWPDRGAPSQHHAVDRKRQAGDVQKHPEHATPAVSVFQPRAEQEHTKNDQRHAKTGTGCPHPPPDLPVTNRHRIYSPSRRNHADPIGVTDMPTDQRQNAGISFGFASTATRASTMPVATS